MRTPFMYYTRKLEFYTDWYNEMSEVERETEVGKWVIGNIKIFSSIVIDIEREIGTWTGRVTNYKSN